MFAGLEPRRVPQSANLTAGLNVKGADSGDIYLLNSKNYIRKEFTTMKIIGYQRSNFKGDQGNEIRGMRIYLTSPLTSGQDVEGEACECVYMTDDKLARCGYVPKVGDEVNVSYNRYRKPDNITRIKT